MPNFDPKSKPEAPVLALDLGQKIIGVAISDAIAITIKRLAPLKRTNWKKLLQDVESLIERFDARTLVIGLPLRLDGAKGSAAAAVEHLAVNFARSLSIEVYLQDERLTSQEADQHLRQSGRSAKDIPRLIDSEAAAIILRDFLNGREEKLPVRRESS